MGAFPDIKGPYENKRPPKIKRENIVDIKKTAYHEAGHAVAAYRFGHYVDEITIIKKDDILGSSKSETEWGGNIKSYIEQIIVLYAGFAAERKYNVKANKRGSINDDEHATVLLRFTNEKETSLRKKAKEIINKNWIIIEAIAEKLIEYKTLKADEWVIIIDCFDEGEENWEECFFKLKNFNFIY